MTALADYEIEDRGVMTKHDRLIRRIGALETLLEQEREKNAKLERRANKWVKHVRWLWSCR